MKLSKRIISAVICLAMILPISVFRVAADSATQLKNTIAIAKSMLYQDGTPLSRRQLKAKYDFAVALVDGGNATRTDYTNAYSELNAAIKDYETIGEPARIEIGGFSNWNETVVKNFTDLNGCAVIYNDSSITVATTGGDTALFSNAVSDIEVVGADVFGGDISLTSGLRVKTMIPDISLATSMNVSVGVRNSEDTLTYTATDVPLKNGYSTIGWDMFLAEYDALGSTVPLDGSLNYIAFSFSGVQPGFVAHLSDLHCFYEDVLTSENAAYSEVLATEFTAEKYYKIVDKTTGLALSASAHVTDTEMNGTRVECKQSGVTITMAERKQDATQEWQIYPYGDGTYRIINKDSSLMLGYSSGKIVFADFVGNYYGFQDVTPQTNGGVKWIITAKDYGYRMYIKGNPKSSNLSYDGTKAIGSTTIGVWEVYECVYGEWQNVWGDEFDGDSLDKTKWTAYEGHTRGDEEPIYFSSQKEYVNTENGELVIRTKVGDNSGWPITGAYITTEGHFYMSYGKVEMRAKLSTGLHIWPALWMMGMNGNWPDNGEIDIMELVDDGNDGQGRDTASRLYGTLHWLSDYLDGGEHFVKGMELYNQNYESLGDDYHTYGLEWEANQLRLYFDGMQYVSLNFDTDAMRWSYGDNPHYLILNTSCRGPGDKTIYSDTADTSEFKVDYIRVSKRSTDMTETEEHKESDPTDSTRISSEFYNGEQVVTSPNGLYYFACDFGGRVNKYNAKTGELLATNSLGSPAIEIIASNSKYIAASLRSNNSSRSGKIYVFKDFNLSQYSYLEMNGLYIEAMEFAPDDSVMYFGGKYDALNTNVSNNKKLFVMNPVTGNLITSVEVGSDIRTISASPDGNYVAVGMSDGHVAVLDSLTYDVVVTYDMGYTVRSVKFLFDGERIVATNEMGDIKVYNTAEEENVLAFANIGASSIKYLSVSPDGSKIAVTTSDNCARLFDLTNGRLLALLDGFEQMTSSVEFSSDGNYIAVGSYDGTIRIYTGNGGYLFTYNVVASAGYGTTVNDIAISSYGSVMAVVNYNNSSVYFCKLPKLSDKSSLYAAVREANSFDMSLYTDSTVANLLTALKTANPILCGSGFASYDIATAVNNIKTAISELKLNPNANIPINGFKRWRVDDLTIMTSSGCKLSISEQSVAITPNVNQAICVSSTSTSAWKFYNYTSSKTISGENPFGVDLSNYDGISFWAKGLTKELTTAKVYIGYTAAEGSFLFSAALPKVTTSGLYVKIPFSDFAHESGEETLDLTKLNTIGFYGKGAKGIFAFTELTAYSIPGTEPVISGVSEGIEYDITTSEPPKASWDLGTALLDGNDYIAETPITEVGTHMLSVNNHGTVKSVTFTIKDDTATPVISGVGERQVYDIYKQESALPAWDVGTATLNGEAYDGSVIDEVGDYTLVVTNGYKIAELRFFVVDTFNDSIPILIKGDPDGDGVVTVSDALITLKISAKIIDSTPELIKVCNVDADEEITVADALMILRVAVKLVSSL